jgi:excisionase family DNA binding protein
LERFNNLLQELNMNTPTPDTKLLLTIAEAKNQLNCGRDQLYHLIKSGTIDSTRIGHRRKVFAESLNEYVANLPRGWGGSITNVQPSSDSEGGA